MAGDFSQAERVYSASLALAQRIPHNLLTAEAMLGLARCYRRQGRQQDVIRICEQGIPFATAGGNRRLVADLSAFEGLSYRTFGESELAIAAFTRSRDACAEIHQVACEMGAVNNIGLVQTDDGEYQTAAATFLAGLPRAVNTVHEAAFLNNLAVAYGDQGDWETGLVYFERGLEVGRKSSNVEVIALSLTNISETYEVRKMPKEGLAAVEEAIRLAEPIHRPRVVGLALLSRGRLNRLMGRPEAAMADWQRAFEQLEAAGETGQASKALALMAAMQSKLGHDAEALEFAAKARTAASSVGQQEGLRSALDTSGLVYRRTGRLAEAKVAFAQEIAVIEAATSKIDRGELTQFLAEKMNPYYALMEIAAEEHQSEAALRSLERAKARHLLDALVNGHAGVSRSMTAAERQQEQKLSQAVETKTIEVFRTDTRVLRGSLESAQRELTAFRAVLYAAHPELKSRRDESAPFSLADVEPLLPRTGPRTALVEYALFNERLFIFVLTRGGGPRAVSRQNGGDRNAMPIALRVVSAPWPAADAEREIAALQSSLARRSVGYRTGAQALYQRLLAPIAPELEGKAAIGVVPDGVLWNVPFQALLQPNGRYLLEDHAIFYAPSLTVLRETAKTMEAVGGRTLLALGAPALGRFAGALAPDPESGVEVAQIAELYSGNLLLTGSAARKSAWLAEAPKSSVIHVATHGVLNTNNPLHSYLVLADGLIEAREILEMRLQARVVVLSACETGRGNVSGGEGLIGMSWAFLMAGSRNTVVSQWKVDSSSTHELMLRFHKNLGAGPAYALQRAALKTMQHPDFKHPFYWAGFVVAGTGR